MHVLRFGIVIIGNDGTIRVLPDDKVTRAIYQYLNMPLAGALLFYLYCLLFFSEIYFSYNHTKTIQMKRKHSINRLFRLLLACMIGLITSLSVFAQERDITGVVTDAQTGEVLIGVNVSVAGTTTGTITDAAGSYALRVSPGQSVVFSYVGYQTITVEVTNQTVIDMALNVSAEALD